MKPLTLTEVYSRTITKSSTKGTISGTNTIGPPLVDFKRDSVALGDY
jgi:hypothetical protein